MPEDSPRPPRVRPGARLDRFFDRRGPLASALPGFTPRPQQLALARGVELALAEGRPCLAEAGTGTGKTIGYLVPLLRFLERTGGRAILSTHTLALQAQLVERDIPALLTALPEWDIRPAVLKGRGNYLCLQDLEAAYGTLNFSGSAELDLIRHWSNRTETGDMAELEFRYAGWGDVAANIDTCRGRECRFYEHCFYFRARRGAEEANLLVVNHSLFFADLRLRALAPGVPHLIPDYDAVVFDEAHHVEGIATRAFGLEWGSFRVPQLTYRLRGLIEPERLQTLQQLHDTLMSPFHQAQKAEAFLDEALSGDSDRAAFHEIRADLCLHLNAIARDLVKLAEVASSQSERDRASGLARTATRVSTELAQVAKAGEDEPGYFRWYHTRRSRNDQPYSILTRTPLAIDTLMRESLLCNTPRSIFVSATLATAEGFEYLKGRLGLVATVKEPPPPADPPDTESGAPPDFSVNEPSPSATPASAPSKPPVEIIEGSPFDFENNCLLYVPRTLGTNSGGDPGTHAACVADEIMALIAAARGRTFVLFTSHRMLTAVRDRIWGRCEYPLFAQGDRANGKLVEAFVAAENAVLLGTSSFWEGVDVPGPALSCVIIDKLPFATPDSPMQRAREKYIKDNGGEPFRDLSLPQAQMRLKQGFGRLLRKSTDRGVVAILDNRLWTKRYGRAFFTALPPCPRTDDIADVRAFFHADHATDGRGGGVLTATAPPAAETTA